MRRSFPLLISLPLIAALTPASAMTPAHASTPSPERPLGNPVQGALAAFDCQQGDTAACVHAALELRELLAPDHRALVEQALPAAQAACDAGDPAGCGRLGAGLLLLSPNTIAEAYDLLTRSCDAGWGWSCESADRALDSFRDGRHSDDALTKLDSYFRTLAPLCEGGDLGACANLTQLHATLPNVTLDRAIWHDLTQQSCEQGHGRSCGHIGFLYSEAARPEIRKALGSSDEYDTNPNRHTSHAFSLKACELGNVRGCFNVGVDLELDDWKASQHYFARACQLGDVEGCRVADAETYWNDSRPTSELRAACEADDFSACAVLLEDDSPVVSQLQEAETEAERSKVLDYAQEMEAICLNGSALACGWAAEALFESQTINPKVERLAFGGCNLQNFGADGRACTVLGQYTAAHHPDGLSRARALYEYACEIEYSDGCVAAGSLFEHGHGVTASLRNAVRFYEQACQYGNFRGCYRTAKFIATAPPEEAEALQEMVCGMREQGCDDG